MPPGHPRVLREPLRLRLREPDLEPETAEPASRPGARGAQRTRLQPLITEWLLVWGALSHQALPARDRLIVYHRGRSSSLAGIYTCLGFVLEKVLMRQPRAGRDVCR
jgi:hypothetical protein